MYARRDDRRSRRVRTEADRIRDYEGKLTDARRLAVEVLREVRLRNAYARELVNTRRAGERLAAAEFDYMQVLVYGVVMCRGTLDKLVNRNLNSPADIKDDVRDALRISAYELLFLHKPDHVVVSQGVELVRYIAPKAAGLGNAVLRKMAGDAKRFPWGDPACDMECLAWKYGMPLWLVRRFDAQMGREATERFMEVCLQPAPTYTLANPYAQHQRFASDLAAQQTAALVPVDGTVLEIGAGRGTKTLLLQRNAYVRHGTCATIHTVDVHPYKQQLLEERLEQMKVPGVSIHVGDARDLSAVEGLPRCFDAVFVDAPCSGTGTLRRHPEVRWRLRKKDVRELVELQLQMLRQASARVCSGGTLVYATCSVLQEENQRVVEAFLASSEGARFDVEPAKPAFPEFDDCITPEGYFASLPVEKGPDGHFAAVFRCQG